MTLLPFHFRSCQRLGFPSFICIIAPLVIGLMYSLSAACVEPASRASIQPALVRLAPGGTCQFNIVLAPRWLQPATLAAEIEWSVNGRSTGDDTSGSISAAGLYRAPKKVASPKEIHICARIKEASNPFVWATVIVGKGDIAYTQTSIWSEKATETTTGLNMPLGLAVDRDGTLLIADTAMVFRYKRDGTLVERFGIKKEGDASPVVGPRDVAVADDGRIFICDAQTGPPRVKVFNHAAERIGGFGPKGIGPGQIMQSQGMAIDPERKRLLVADSENMRINVYTLDGDLVAMWDKAGVMPTQFAEPYGVVLDRNGDVFIPNHYGPCQKFTPNGDYLGAFALPDPPHGVVNITAAAGDQWGNIYLAVRDSAGIPLNSVHPEPKPVRIFKYTNTGELITIIPLWNDECSENKMFVDDADRLHILFHRGDKVGMATFEQR